LIVATATLEPAFTLGEVAPALFGRFDLARLHTAAATERNMFVGYRGGAYSRAGTAFVGFSKQTGRTVPPRLITFQFSINQGLALEFGDFYMRVIVDGAFVTETPIAVTNITQANPAVVSAVNNYANGDWVFIAGVGGMTQVNGQTYVIGGRTPGSFQLFDIYGNKINSTAFGAFTFNGTVARIYTLPTIYAEADLNYLKVTQSADVMSICCVNQETATEYPAQDLNRQSDTNWTFTPVIPNASIEPPGEPTVIATGTGTTSYSYEVTAVSAADGTESVASPTGGVDGAVDIFATAGTILITWAGVTGASVYNIYKAEPGYNTLIPAGVQYGYAGQSYGGSFLDSNVIPDFTQVPPTHQNPFARGQILEADVTLGGSGESFDITINTTTGSGAVLIPVVDFDTNTLTAIVVSSPGINYAQTDTLSINNGAAATLTVGPETGTYPGTVTYFQQRRTYGYTLNQTDTYFMSQPGSYTNFDFRNPTIDSDAITGSPWSLQVNGIQFMIPTAGGLLVFTGLSCWLLVGAGSFATNVQAISPSSQLANPQPAIGCSSTLQPIKINYDVIFTGSKNSFYYDLPYQLYALSEPIDITVNSPQLFTGFTFIQHAWCEQPYRLLWAIRNDGVMLSLTWLKEQQVQGWCRHDTNGTFESLCAVIEPPVDALYVATQRTIGVNTPYIIERTDNRIWPNVEQTWCVDCGFSLPMQTPQAALTASSATGLGSVTGATGLVGGTGYSAATFGVVTDQGFGEGGLPGPGTGAVPTLTIVGGVITNVVFSGGNQGSGYLNPKFQAIDPAGSAGGSGASAVLVLNNTMTFTIAAAHFEPTDVGSVIRMGGGVATITAYISLTQVTGNITTPISAIQANSVPAGIPQVAAAGTWTQTTPVSSVLVPQLAGATVTGLADGVVIPPTVVPANGVLVLPGGPASAVTIGLGFQAQLQSVYLDVQDGAGTVQAQRKKIAAANVLLESSRGVKMGSNQVDGSTLSPIQVAPVWGDLDNVPDLGARPFNSVTVPLFTGYVRVPVQGGFQKPGQVCLQQDNPLPLNVLSLVPEFLEGDTPSQNVPQKQQKAA
jgi:hypothetical protein